MGILVFACYTALSSVCSPPHRSRKPPCASLSSSLTMNSLHYSPGKQKQPQQSSTSSCRHTHLQNLYGFCVFPNSSARGQPLSANTRYTDNSLATGFLLPLLCSLPVDESFGGQKNTCKETRNPGKCFSCGPGLSKPEECPEVFRQIAEKGFPQPLERSSHFKIFFKDSTNEDKEEVTWTGHLKWVFCHA